MMRQPSAAFSNGGGQCGEYLFSVFQFQSDPALTDKNDLKNDIEVHSRNQISEPRFRNPGSKEYNRSNEK